MCTVGARYFISSQYTHEMNMCAEDDNESCETISEAPEEEQLAEEMLNEAVEAQSALPVRGTFTSIKEGEDMLFELDVDFATGTAQSNQI
jgi:hypothetical protein